MIRKPIGHKDKYSNRREISQNHSNDGTAARTRPYSFDEIMQKRKNKRVSGSVENHRLASEIVIVSGKDESISGRIESDRHRPQHASYDSLKLSSRTKENRSIREDKVVEGDHKESDNTRRRWKIGSDNAKDRRKERGGIGIHEKRKNQDRLSDEFDNEHGKIHGKYSGVKEKDRNLERNRGKSEHVNRLTQNEYDERGRDQVDGKKLESRKRHERDKRRSNSPSPRVNKQRLYEELPSHSLKDKKPTRLDSKIERKRVSDNDSSNKSKRHDTSVSRLGGYSPRKRRSEAAVKTPSPIDSPLVKTEDKLSTSLQPQMMSSNKTEVSNRHEVLNVVHPLTSIVPKPTFGVLSFPSLMNASVDSVQLTQATRPKRRIYVENLPSSATETAVVEWLSGYLRPYGLSHIQGTNPCISCIVNKDKGQAVVEFLTPEDASTALSFDGKSFFGNILKIRRPKDYVETTTGVSEKPVVGAVSIKNIVEDSPNKIFIGGISKIITSEMLMEIASAFGPLKAYHFEPNSNLETPCAFLEYVDQSVTIKACVGLNGMKLGGQLLTVTQATPDTSSMDNRRDHRFYGTPAHAQPLLKKQTQVLKLNNLVDPHSLSSLSEQELEEILEDVRLECSRFGMVKSINIVKPTNMSTSSETEPPEEPVAAPTGGSGSDGGGNEPEEANDMEENDCKAVDDDVAENKPEIESFEGGCVLVEYKRIEACEMAAHCLHGRIFDGRVVSVEYVAHDVYCSRFEK